jgi:hypothetical protein
MTLVVYSGGIGFLGGEQDEYRYICDMPNCKHELWESNYRFSISELKLIGWITVEIPGDWNDLHFCSVKHFDEWKKLRNESTK